MLKRKWNSNFFNPIEMLKLILQNQIRLELRLKSSMKPARAYSILVKYSFPMYCQLFKVRVEQFENHQLGAEIRNKPIYFLAERVSREVPVLFLTIRINCQTVTQPKWEKSPMCSKSTSDQFRYQKIMIRHNSNPSVERKFFYERIKLHSSKLSLKLVLPF